MPIVESRQTAKSLFAYIRVSTIRQGEHGVSLQEQRDAVRRYAEHHGLSITEWFEEQETAAKQGRPIFQRMLDLLKAGKAQGFVVHKLDRSTRNLRDWVSVEELADRGLDIHFANEGLNLQTRGGRLAADIQAVVASDYIRNLREEAKKGIYGRLKQGIYPCAAPIGYLDCGKGKLKALDPQKAPLVRRLFELYGTGRFNLDTLLVESNRLGLRNRREHALKRSPLALMLNNPFYTGLIRIRRSGETFQGAHVPLVPVSLYRRVQEILHGRIKRAGTVHDYLFRRLLRCHYCGYHLIGEGQKGHVYYRCHTRGCPTRAVREELVDDSIRSLLKQICFSEGELAYFRRRLTALTVNRQDQQTKESAALKLRLGQINSRLERLTDAFLDGALDRQLLDERKQSLLLERQQVEQVLSTLGQQNASATGRLAKFLELAKTAQRLYEMGNCEEKRELLEIVTSNRTVNGKNVVIEPSIPFSEALKRQSVLQGAPQRDTPRTLFNKLLEWFMMNTAHSAPALERLADQFSVQEKTG